MAGPQPPRKTEVDLRSGTLLFLALLALAILLLRLWYLQVVRSDELKRKAYNFQSRSVPLPAARGVIQDRHGEMLASSESSLVISLLPSVAEKNPESMHWLAAKLDQPYDSIKEEVEKNRWRRYAPTPILAGAEIDLASEVSEGAFRYPAVRVDSQPMRTYPDPETFAHVLGYVWVPSANDLERLKKQKLKPAPYVGKTGLEAVYEGALRGRNGLDRIEVDGQGRPVRVLEHTMPSPGGKLVLGLDANLQKEAIEALGGRIGAVVAMEPASGEILCLASAPTYNTQPFLRGVSQEEFSELNEDPTKPFLNRAITGAYAPGSTFKIITTLAAAREGKLSMEKTVLCRGYYEVGDRKLKCLGVHGDISFQNAFAKSCNAYFADLAVRTGERALKEVALSCGLGAKTEVDLLGEARGVVPTDAWRKEHLPKEEFRWRTGDTVNLGIGQGRLSVTPIQMAALAAMVANKGVWRQPHLVRQILSTDTARPVSWKSRTPLSNEESVWSELHTAMSAVIERGTARSARIYGLDWAGKTGSTEHRRDEETHSWFVGFAPLNDPKIAIAVLIEKAGHGGEVAAPIAAQLVERYLERLER